MKTPRITILVALCLSVAALSVYAQENTLRKDSLKFSADKPLPVQTDSVKADRMDIAIPTINPSMGKDGLQHNRFNDFSVNPYLVPGTNPSRIQFFGTGSDYVNSKSRTAVATYSPVAGISLYSAASLGLIETPFFGKGNYYMLHAGANYRVSSNLSAGLSGTFNSNFNVVPFWNVSADLRYLAGRNLMLEGSLGYMQTGANMFHLSQSAVLIDLHARYRLSDDWFLNAYGGFPVSQNTNRPAAPMMPMMNNRYYGGTVEYWFQPTVGAEAGLIWVRDMFSGKMRPQPKLELKFRPGR